MLHEHAPALPRRGKAADDGVQGYENVVSLDGAILERDVQWKMPAADRDAGRIARNQRAGDSQIRLIAHEMFGIVETERQTNHRGDGRQRNVALRKV